MVPRLGSGNIGDYPVHLLLVALAAEAPRLPSFWLQYEGHGITARLATLEPSGNEHERLLETKIGLISGAELID